jgi:ABC-2 type transport system ATP-binding protein/lipopolysaccharide transport system ATP-binding protein
MPRPAVIAEGIGKRYRLGVDHRGSRGRTVDDHDTLIQSLANRLRGDRRERREIWALRDVDIEVPEGEVMGFIGRNGSGKSTLLKVLARITAPTEGRATISGRVGALLEVGTGFHPELTGRENVFLNGALLGLTRREIRRRFDEIVEFAGVGRFLDTPVKRYSSGMQLRLAFSVAAHLEPDVLIVDEVLAVGDAEFQARCLGRMSEIQGSGRTILFVSHDLSLIRNLCRRAVWLSEGRVVEEGPSADIVRSYLSSPGVGTASPLSATLPRKAGLAAQPTRVDLRTGTEGGQAAIPRDRPFEVRVTVEVEDPRLDLDLAVYVMTLDGVRVIDDDVRDHGPAAAGRFGRAGVVAVQARVPAVLAPGRYRLGIWLGTPRETFFDSDVLSLEILPAPGDRPAAVSRRRLVQPPVEWEIESAARPIDDD